MSWLPSLPLVLGPVRCLAAQTPSTSEFVAVRGGGETTSAEALLITAYVVMWLLTLLVVYMTWRKQNALDQRLADLERDMRATSGDSAETRAERRGAA